jgi:hypothetical protein
MGDYPVSARQKFQMNVFSTENMTAHSGELRQKWLHCYNTQGKALLLPSFLRTRRS